MYFYPPSIEELISYLTRLPGVGPKTAQRLALHLLNTREADALGLAQAISEARRKVKRCRVCGNLTDDDCCPVCLDDTRDNTTLCVVEQPGDCIVIERTNQFHGRYHVLHGSLSPMEGIGPADLNIESLLKRLQGSDIKEVIMATNTGVEGEATALYLARQIKPLGISVSRLAYGVAVGGDLEYTDEVTLGRALQGRLNI
ncbi:MAG: recombination protein RecR [Firmicutes bacterium]|nr:recombination protein RecR [Bacillota bacterium]